MFSATLSKLCQKSPTRKIVTETSPGTWARIVEFVCLFSFYFWLFVVVVKFFWLVGWLVGLGDFVLAFPFRVPIFNLQLGFGHYFKTGLLVKTEATRKI